jgi:hypothetical protein
MSNAPSTTGHDAVERPPLAQDTAAPNGIPRRSLLRAAGIGTATVLVAGTAALTYRVFDTAALDPDGGDAFDPWRHWQKTGPLGCVAAAILAANPHNSQAWTFEVSDTAISLSADPSRSTGTLDPSGRELQIGLGCVLENLVIAAEKQGLGPVLTLLPDGPTAERVGTVRLTGATAAGTGARPDLYQAIGHRHTNRGPYLDTPVPAATLARLVDTTALPGLAVAWITDPDGRAAVGRLMLDAATAITRDQQQSRDSFAWFRSSDDDIQKHRDGLTLDGQGLPALTLTAAKLLPASSRSAGDDFWLTQTRDVHTKTAVAYGVITAADPGDRRTRLQAGRLLQRIHLLATTEKVALHHMNQITERIDREQDTAATAVFEPRFAALLPAEARPMATFRVGRPVREARLSPRRPVSQVTR